MDRSKFFKSMIGGAGLAAGLAAKAKSYAAPPKQAQLNLCSQEGRLPGNGLREKVANLVAWGGKGIEFGGNPGGRIKEIQEILADTPIRVSALCWGSCNGDLVSMDMKKRRSGIDQLKSALETAGALKANGVIFVPCFHGQSDLKPAELDKVLAEVLPEVGAHAVECGTHVLLEPLQAAETFYLNRLEQAVALCEAAKSPGIAIMGDFFHMNRQERDERKAFVTAGDRLLHVHTASRKTRTIPGSDKDNYVDGFRGLKKIGYQQFVSLECGVKRGFDPMKQIPECFRMMERQWEAATI